MKAVRNVYIVMNAIMIAACIAGTVLGMLEGFNALYLIAPLAALVIFVVSITVKSKDVLTGLMKIVLSSHIAVIITVTQGAFVFHMGTGNAIAIVAIATGFISFMIWAVKKMFVKITSLNNDLKTTDNQETK